MTIEQPVSPPEDFCPQCGCHSLFSRVCRQCIEDYLAEDDIDN